MKRATLDDFTQLSGWSVAASGQAQLDISPDRGTRGAAMRLDFDFKGGGGFVVSRLCVHEVVAVTRKSSVIEAATLMRQHHVGALVVVDETPAGSVPLGVVTDRDIVVEVVASRVPPDTMTVGDIVQRPVITVRQDAGYAETIRLMCVNGVRRLPVVDGHGRLVGIVTIDDMLHHLAGPLLAVAELAGRGRHFETKSRR